MDVIRDANVVGRKTTCNPDIEGSQEERGLPLMASEDRHALASLKGSQAHKEAGTSSDNCGDIPSSTVRKKA